ncbi:MAG: DUF4157 domain-containing protein [Gemmatimonadota bacterium]|nr:DUF4157 domain-containing protein [Gemmatimonadota bacterium]
MGFASNIVRAVVGEKLELPRALTEKYPELKEARYRAGGLPLRIGGWALGASHVSGFTLGRTIFLHDGELLDETLLLHELRHVHQFRERKSFPVRYLWQSIRRGYRANPYEVDARRFSAIRLRISETDPDGGV